MTTPNIASDIGQFFDFGEAAIPDTAQEANAVQKEPRVNCPAHGNDSTDGCICHGFFGDYTVPEEIQETNTQPQEWNPDFSNWLPRYHKPAHPCEYCRSRSLECFIFNATGDKSDGCSPCNALFRPCSFSVPEAMPLQKSKTALDTLDLIAEDSERHFGGLTGRKQLRCLGHVGPIEDDHSSNTGSKKGAAAARFPRVAVKILKDWMIEHIDHPYPTEEEKETLKLETGLTIGQISNWMANTRRRQKARPKRAASPSIRPSTEVIDIPPGRTWDDLNPFERWKHSPPENEPAPMTAIAKAVENFDLPRTGTDSLSSSYNGRSRMGNSNGSTGSFSVFRAPSTTSLETGFTNMSSGSGTGSAWSHGSRNSLGSLNSLNSKKERRRRRKVATRTPKLDLESAPRPFQCTFCTDRFKSKYDWSRHEKSLHLSLEKWICAPLGEVITSSSSGRRKCVYCDTVDPTKDHLATHNHSACVEKGREARTFYRKDHLRQHLRLMHGCKMTPSMETWKAEVQFINSRCGFCAMTFDKWQDRIDHLAKEFRNGADMKNWKGCRGLDAHVAAFVNNAMPPYLIANESKSPFPFSATSSASLKHHNMHLEENDLEYLLPNDKITPDGVFIPHQMGDINLHSSVSTSPTNKSHQTSSASATPHPNPNATCWEILTLRLGRFAREYIEKNGVSGLTDEMLQHQARLILYDSDDTWNQTAADNPEWLGLFKQAHGLSENAPLSGDIAQHEVLEDLGLGLNAQLDKSFSLKNFRRFHKNDNISASQALAFECTLAGSLNITKTVNSLGESSTPFTLPPLTSATTSITSNLPPSVSSFSPDFPCLSAPLSAPMERLACTLSGGECIDDNGGIAKGGKKFFFANTANTEMTPVEEMSRTTSGEPIQDHFGFPTWDQLPEGFEVPTTNTMDTSAPVSTSLDMGFGDGGLSALGMDMGMGMDTSGSGTDIIQGTMDNPQVMHWDDSELGFDLDMDLDHNLDMIMGNTNTNTNNAHLG